VSDPIEHPQLGTLRWYFNDQAWLGKIGGHELLVGGDSDEIDPECEALAVRELADLDGLLERIAAFLAVASEPYLNQWAERNWEVLSLIFRRDGDGPSRFMAEYLLERDEYTVWQVAVQDGTPVALGRR
jgi:hypothetical protein